MHVEKWALGLAFAVVIIVCLVVGLVVGYSNGYNKMAIECNKLLDQNNRSWQSKMDTAIGNLNRNWQSNMDTAIGNLNRNWQSNMDTAIGDLNRNWQFQIDQWDKQWLERLNREKSDAYNAGLSVGLSSCEWRNSPCDCQPQPDGDQHDGGHDGHDGHGGSH